MPDTHHSGPTLGPLDALIRRHSCAAELARQIGVDRSTLSRARGVGRKIHLEPRHLAKICDVTGASVQEALALYDEQGCTLPAVIVSACAAAKPARRARAAQQATP